MDSVLFFQSLWFLIIGLALFVFTVLDGFDLGVGMLLPFGFKTQEQRVKALSSIWPVWDGNELWGLTAGGTLFGIFPVIFGLVLTAFYPFVILLLVALMYRPVAFEMWSHNPKARNFWQAVFAICSATITLLLGIVLGNTIIGIPLSPAKMDSVTFSGSLLLLVQPYAVISGLAFSSLCLVHGASWLLVKLEDESQTQARFDLIRVWPISFVLAVLWFVLTLFLVPGARDKPLVYIAGLCLLACMAILRVLAGGRGEKRIFSFSTLIIGFFWALIAAVQFPVLFRDSANLHTITIQNAGGAASTQQFLGIVSPIILLLVAGYSFYVYRVFKGKARGIEY